MCVSMEHMLASRNCLGIQGLLFVKQNKTKKTQNP